jgi:hypothetical protein
MEALLDFEINALVQSTHAIIGSEMKLQFRDV